MKQSKKGLLSLTAIVALLVNILGCYSNHKLPGIGINVRSAYGVLEELFQAEIVNIGLKQLGYNVTRGAEIEYDIIHQAIANNYLDYTAVHWHPTGIALFEENGGNQTMTRVGVLSQYAIQGYLIDKKTAENFKITKLEQLKDPKIAKIFDTDGNGKSNLIGCNPGWVCQSVIDHHLKVYGLSNTVEHEQGNYEALIKDTITRFDQGQPILYFAWTPYWLNAVLIPSENVEWLEVPFTSLTPGQQKSLGKNSDITTIIDGKNLGYPGSKIMVVANNKFLNKNPAARRFFELVKIPIDEISAQNYLMKKGENKPEDIRRHAEKWVSDNKEKFETWLEEARQAR